MISWGIGSGVQDCAAMRRPEFRLRKKKPADALPIGRRAMAPTVRDLIVFKRVLDEFYSLIIGV